MHVDNTLPAKTKCTAYCCGFDRVMSASAARLLRTKSVRARVRFENLCERAFIALSAIYIYNVIHEGEGMRAATTTHINRGLNTLTNRYTDRGHNTSTRIHAATTTHTTQIWSQQHTQIIQANSDHSQHTQHTQILVSASTHTYKLRPQHTRS